MKSVKVKVTTKSEHFRVVDEELLKKVQKPSLRGDL